ncbi:hypothetical protein [Novosphingobium resinovorum]|uniref:hypothetical protein n=1 Tax=Novosphingobium resinovorum TaxID=158500 RepID=UPI002ED626D6|nr:hypothetical protein [Novosphingobium resinovorum]
MTDMRLTMMEAISRRRLVQASYNGSVINLAPHLLFERHGDLFVAALNIDKTWRSDEDPRLGQFKLAGLADATLKDDEFSPLPADRITAPREDDITLLTVEV